MYAEHRYTPRQSRSVSLGAAFLINGALIAGLVYSAPNVIPKIKDGGITIIDLTDPPVPPPLDPPKPQPDARTPTAPQPNAPDPRIKTDSPNTTSTTTEITPPLPPLPPLPDSGPAAAADPPLAPPALIGATADPRYARDFQPAYPAAELRAQRDGVVRIRVLIGIDGRVKAAESVSATSDAFFEATRRQALAKWRFKPATRGGVPQESWKTMNVRFELTNQ